MMINAERELTTLMLLADKAQAHSNHGAAAMFLKALVNSPAIIKQGQEEYLLARIRYHEALHAQSDIHQYSFHHREEVDRRSAHRTLEENILKRQLRN